MDAPFSRFKYREAENIIDNLTTGNRNNEPGTFRDWQGPLIVLMRGLPGSGKSTFARELLFHAMTEGFTAEVVSADFWFQRIYGYRFVGSQIRDAHRWCKNMFEAAVARQVHVIIVDNTNIKPTEYQYYLDAVVRLNRRLHVVEFKCESEENALALNRRSRSQPPDDLVLRRYREYNQEDFKNYGDRLSIIDPLYPIPDQDDW